MLTGTKPIIYPDSDGQPMADNTKQFDWIAMIKGELDSMFADNPDVFVAGDLLWYAVEGHPEIRVAPDALVAFGRPKGYRGSYKQWEEGGIAPQVVFEVLSPGNRMSEMVKKLGWYNHYGVEEYYIIDPDKNDLTVYIRTNGSLEAIEDVNGWVSPRLGIVFEIDSDEVRLYRPDKRPFTGFVDLERLRTEAVAMAVEERQKAEVERQKAETERQKAEIERQKAETERQRAERLSERLRALGVNPDEL